MTTKVLLQVVDTFVDEPIENNVQESNVSLTMYDVNTMSDLANRKRTHFARNEEVLQNPQTRVFAGGPSLL